MSKVDEGLANLILKRKNRRSTKADIIRQYREEILELRQRRFSLADICTYLESKYNLSVSPETLKKAVPELVNKVERVIKLLSSLSCSELNQVAKAVRERLEECKSSQGSGQE